MNRRDVLKMGGALLVSGFGDRFAFAKDLASQGRLVVVYLYGGADPLTFFPPFGDDAYYIQRPSIGVKKNDVVQIDELFGLHRAMSPLLPIMREGEMSILHQFGSPNVERSHSIAQNRMESGVIESSPSITDGFLDRALVAKFGASDGPLRSVALQGTLPSILHGSSKSVAFASIDEWRNDSNLSPSFMEHLQLFKKSSGGDEMGRIAEAAVMKLRKAFAAATRIERAPDFIPDIDTNLDEIARLVQADVGLRVAFTSAPAWDTHSNQLTRLEPKMKNLADGLTRFRTALKKSGHWKGTTVVVMTEFGRVVKENGALGTDHGLGSAAMLLGDSISPKIAGKVVHQWKSIKPENLSEERELHVHLDYRDVFGDLLVKRLGLSAEQLSSVFPKFTYKSPGFMA